MKKHYIAISGLEGYLPDTHCYKCDCKEFKWNRKSIKSTRQIDCNGAIEKLQSHKIDT